MAKWRIVEPDPQVTTVADLPDWVTLYDAAHWERVALAATSPQVLEEYAEMYSAPGVIIGPGLWRKAQRAWAAEHAPDVTRRELGEERKCRERRLGVGVVVS